MMKRALAIPVLLGCTCATLACTQDNLLGEDGCFGTNTECTSDAPTVSALASGDDHVFDIVAASTIRPRWVFDQPCVETCYPQIAPAPDGSVWVLMGEQAGSTLLEVDDQGQLAHSDETDFVGTLSVDQDLSAQLARWQGRDANIQRFLPGGERSERTVSLPPPYSTRGISYPSLDVSGEGSVVGILEEGGAWVAKYDAKGRLLWKQTDIRAARRYPFQDFGAGLSVPTFFELVQLSDGALAVGMPKYLGDEADESTTERYRGVSVLDADGNLRWDAVIDYDFGLNFSAPHIPLLSAAPNGDLVFVASGQDLMRVVVMDGRSGAIDGWTGTRIGYFAVTPSHVCADSAGNIYVIVVTGERNAGKYTLCKMRSGDPTAPPECSAMELPPEFPPPFGSGLSYLSQSVTGMACPAPGEIVLSAAPSGDMDKPRRILLVGITF